MARPTGPGRLRSTMPAWRRRRRPTVSSTTSATAIPAPTVAETGPSAGQVRPGRIASGCAFGGGWRSTLRVDHPRSEEEADEGDRESGQVVDEVVPAEVDGRDDRPDQEHEHDDGDDPQAVVAGHQQDQAGDSDVKAGEGR